ncbi:hypothetical protein Hanom_Chr06g00549571 [Helianthus anomalus]
MRGVEIERWKWRCCCVELEREEGRNQGSPGDERLTEEKADFEEYKRTEEWSVVAANKQVRSLTKLLSQERKLWNEACAHDNDKFYRLCQEIITLKAANAGLVKKEAIAPTTIEEATFARNRMEICNIPYKTRVDAESARAIKAEENYERVLAKHTTSSVQLDDAKAMNVDFHADCMWMRDYGVVYVAVAVTAIRAKARDAGYKVGYRECLTPVNAVSNKKFIDE